MHAAVDSLRPGRLVQLQYVGVPGLCLEREDAPRDTGERRAGGREIQGAAEGRARLSEPLRHPQCVRLPLSLQPLFRAASTSIRPTTWEELTSKNDVEPHDLETDPEEYLQPGHGPAAQRRLRHDDVRKLNARIDEEVGVDDGTFLPLRDGKLVLPSSQDTPAASLAPTAPLSFGDKPTPD